jgi:signal peptidase I
VEFKDGKLYVDGKELREPYIKYPCKWNKAPLRVDTGCVYVVGDNRSVPIEEHQFGQIEMKRLAGSTIW